MVGVAADAAPATPATPVGTAQPAASRHAAAATTPEYTSPACGTSRPASRSGSRPAGAGSAVVARVSSSSTAARRATGSPG